jgi:hypothetical protein
MSKFSILKRAVGSQKTEVSVPAKPRLHVENFSCNNCFSPEIGQNSKLLQKDFVVVFFTRVPIDFNGEKKIFWCLFLRGRKRMFVKINFLVY